MPTPPLPELDHVLADVRKAYRMLYHYQRRVMDVVSYLKETLRFPESVGYTKFCGGQPRNGYWVNLSNWAWDWLGMYHYEFHLGAKVVNPGQNLQCSVWIISDTGFYDAPPTETSPTAPATFASAAEAQTKLLFEVGLNTWHHLVTGDDSYEEEFKQICSQASFSSRLWKDAAGGILLAKSYPLTRFHSIESVQEVIAELLAFCTENGVPNLSELATESI